MRRMYLAAACAALLSAIAAAPALAVDTASSSGPGGTATYFGGVGEADNVTITSQGAFTVRFNAPGEAILEGLNCFEVDANTTDCFGSTAVVNGRDGDDTLNASALAQQTVTLTAATVRTRSRAAPSTTP